MEPSITSVTEALLVDRILDDRLWRQVIGLPPHTHIESFAATRRELPANSNGRSAGDVDILIMPPGEPQHAIAIEVKRLKVGAGAFHTGEPNGLANLYEGIRQANHLASLGFHRVYLYILVLVDSRENNGGAYSFAGLTPALIDRLRSSYRLSKLESRIGVVESEFTQPVDREPFMTGGASWNWMRHDSAVDQPDSLTKWVQAQFPPAVT
jgi:hypothetical protein